MRCSHAGSPAVCERRWRTSTLPLPLAPNSGQYRSTGASTSTRPRLTSTSSDRQLIVFVVEKTLMIVSRSHGVVPASSSVPPHRSTTTSPPSVMATDAPTSPCSLKFAANASLTAAKRSGQSPSMFTSLPMSGFLSIGRPWIHVHVPEGEQPVPVDLAQLVALHAGGGDASAGRDGEQV